MDWQDPRAILIGCVERSPLARGFAVLGVKLDADVASAKNLGGKQRAAGPAKGVFCGVVDYVASGLLSLELLTVCAYRTPHNNVDSKPLQEDHESRIGAPRFWRRSVFDLAQG